MTKRAQNLKEHKTKAVFYISIHQEDLLFSSKQFSKVDESKEEQPLGWKTFLVRSNLLALIIVSFQMHLFH